MPQQPMSPIFSKQLIGYCRFILLLYQNFVPLFVKISFFSESVINQKSTSEEKTWDVLSDY